MSSFLAFCGIARPGRFLDLLGGQGIKPAAFLTFPDHPPIPGLPSKKSGGPRRGRGCSGHDDGEGCREARRWSGLFAGLPVYVFEIGLAIDPRFSRCWKRPCGDSQPCGQKN